MGKVRPERNLHRSSTERLTSKKEEMGLAEELKNMGWERCIATNIMFEITEKMS